MRTRRRESPGSARPAAGRTRPGDGRWDSARTADRSAIVITRSMRAPMSTCCRRARLLNNSSAPQISTTDTATSTATMVRRARSVAVRRAAGRVIECLRRRSHRHPHGRQHADQHRHDHGRRGGKGEHAQVQRHLRGERQSPVRAARPPRSTAAASADAGQRRQASRARGSRPATAPRCGRAWRPTPRARAISFRRAALRASSRLVMFAQAISSTRTTAPSATYIDCRKASPTSN